MINYSRVFTVGLVAAFFVSGGGAFAVSAEADLEGLKRNFLNPPADTRSGCYWYWINDNVSTAGITKDLEAMARVGIGRAYIGNIFDYAKKGDTPPGDVKVMTEEWWRALQWAVKEGDRCGVDIGFFNSPGWSQSGGPWIKPSQSMRYLANSETIVDGGGAVDVTLPVPKIDTYPNYGGMTPIRSGPNFSDADFQDVRVVAYRVAEDGADVVGSGSFSYKSGRGDIDKLFDGSDKSFVEFLPNEITSVTIELKPGTAVQNFVIKSLDSSLTMECTVEASPDGKVYKTVASYIEERGHQGPKRLDDIVVPFKGVDSGFLRLHVKFQSGKAVRVAEVSMTNRALLGGYVRKQLGESDPRTHIALGSYKWDTQTPVSSGTAVTLADVVDVTDKVTSGGVLHWEAPAGKWRVQRFGMVPIGTQNSPASDEGRGLEIDKMNKEYATAIFDGLVGEFIRRTPAAERKALKYVIADSYETGPQNWTDDLLEKFEAEYHYSAIPYLPVMTGQVVGSAEESDRFLWDVRHLIVDAVATEYVGGLRDVAHKHGLKLWLENYGHWGFISEFLKYGSQTDEVGGEIWESGNPVDNIECRAAASSAHIYGKNDVYAETFTSSRSFKQSPATLKRWCDWTFGAGINHLILHVYIHQSTEDKPGIIEWFGTAFNRHNTWFEQSKAFMDYIRRGAVMMKAGKPVADVAYYIGENSPSMTGPRDPELPVGYDFDNVNSDVLMNGATVVDGRIVINGGIGYRVMVLPKDKKMRPEVVEAVQELVEAGAIVVGPRPESSPSLMGYPECDAKVQDVAGKVWGDVDGKTVTSRRVGKGWIFDGVGLRDIFAKIDCTPDVAIAGGDGLLPGVAGDGKMGVEGNGGILFKHRRADFGDVYFVSNTSNGMAKFDCSFRQSGRLPSLWNGASGKVESAAAFEQKDGRTVVPLELAPSESIYVVFAGKMPADASGIGKTNSPAAKVIATLNDNWTVGFEGYGAPKSVEFTSLTDWIKHPNGAIAHYSGTANYERTFELDGNTTGKLLLDLGSVGVIADVSINGKAAGTLWCLPWVLDITPFVHAGKNTMSIRVSNTWNNRLAADALKADGEPRTSVSQPYIFDKKHPYLSSGLMGPVTIGLVETEVEK